MRGQGWEPGAAGALHRPGRRAAGNLPGPRASEPQEDAAIDTLSPPQPERERPAPAALPDVELVRRVLQGEPALFEVLMRRHNQRVYRAIRSVLRGDQEAEDAMQQAWLNAFAHLDQYRGTSAFTTWLTRIALNEALARSGRAHRPGPLEDVSEEDEAMHSESQDPEGRAVDRELGRLLEEAIDGLSDGHRSVFVLRDVEGLSTEETAQVLGLSEEAVKVRLHRARHALRDRLYARVGSAAEDTFVFLGARCDRVVARVMARVLASPRP